MAKRLWIYLKDKDLEVLWDIKGYELVELAIKWKWVDEYKEIMDKLKSIWSETNACKMMLDVLMQY